MIKIKQGNILNCTENIIVHQVNVQGIMGGGIARQLAFQYPGLEEEYSKHCKELENNYKLLKGNGVRIDIWTHLMRECIMKLCTPI